MTVTGNLGELMKESISASTSYVRSRTAAFGIEPSRFDMLDIHVHVPEGATPKDGPSVGVATVTATRGRHQHHRHDDLNRLRPSHDAGPRRGGH